MAIFYRKPVIKSIKKFELNCTIANNHNDVCKSLKLNKWKKYVKNYNAFTNCILIINCTNELTLVKRITITYLVVDNTVATSKKLSYSRFCLHKKFSFKNN